MTVEAIVLGPGEGKSMSTLGVELVFKAVGAQTGGSYFAMEYTCPGGWAGPPKHVHGGAEEAFYVLEGELTVYLGDREVHGGAGAFFQVPRGTPHTFANWGDGPAKYLILALPAGLEGYFEELPQLVERHGYPPPPEVMAELGKRYAMETVGPRPSR